MNFFFFNSSATTSLTHQSMVQKRCKNDNGKHLAKIKFKKTDLSNQARLKSDLSPTTTKKQKSHTTPADCDNCIVQCQYPRKGKSNNKSGPIWREMRQE